MEALADNFFNTLSLSDRFTPKWYFSLFRMNPKLTDVNVWTNTVSSSVVKILLLFCFSFWGQGVHLRVVGVSDSKSLVVPVDVLKEELDDELLSEVCSVKSAGSALTTLGALGESDSFTNHGRNDNNKNLFSITGKGEYRVFNGSESRRETEGIAQLLGKSTGQR